MTTLPTAKLRRILALSEKRDALLAETAKIDLAIWTAWREIEPPPKPEALSARQKRGTMKQLILNVLRSAGARGIAAKDIAAELNISPVKVHAWLNMTGKKAGLVEVVARGIYRIPRSVKARRVRVRPR